MTSFSASTQAEAVVLAPQQDIWDVLVDPELMARFTPFLRASPRRATTGSGSCPGSTCWAEGRAGFTERMVLHRSRTASSSTTTRRPVATEQAGVEGWYALTPLDDGTELVTELEITLDLPLPKASGRPCGPPCSKVIDTMGDRFSTAAAGPPRRRASARPETTTTGDLLVGDAAREAERVSVTASSYSITMRLHTAPDHGIVGAVATAISAAGGVVTAIDVVDSTRERLVLDVTCSASDADHSHELEEAVDAIDGVEVYKVSDRTFLLHIGGKIEVQLQGPAAEPRRPVDGLHARRRRGSAWRSTTTRRTSPG